MDSTGIFGRSCGQRCSSGMTTMGTRRASFGLHLAPEASPSSIRALDGLAYRSLVSNHCDPAATRRAPRGADLADAPCAPEARRAARMVWRRCREPQALVAATTPSAVDERVGARQVVGVRLSRHDGHATRRADNDAGGCVTVNHDTLGTQQAASSVDAHRIGRSGRAEQDREKQSETHWLILREPGRTARPHANHGRCRVKRDGQAACGAWRQSRRLAHTQLAAAPRRDGSPLAPRR